jgi:hypothetical protein
MGKDKVFTEQEAVQKMKEMAKEDAEKIAESKTGLSEVLKDKTSGKITLPKVTFRGIGLIENASMVLERDIGGPEQMFVTLWALQNQRNPLAFAIKKDELEDELMRLGNRIEFELMDEYGEAIEEAMEVIIEEGEKGANPPKPKRKARKKATNRSGN